VTAVTAGGVPAHWLTSPAGLWVSEVRLPHLPPLQVPLRVCAFNRDRARPVAKPFAGTTYSRTSMPVWPITLLSTEIGQRPVAISSAPGSPPSECFASAGRHLAFPKRLASMTRSASTARATQTSEASLWQCRGALEREALVSLESERARWWSRTILMTGDSQVTRVGKGTRAKSTRRSVVVSLVVNCFETVGLGLAAWATASIAVRAQTAAEAAQVAVTAFLLIGVLTSVRGPDEAHPLGYGRDRFFWSLFAALGLFVGGGGLALDEAVRSGLHPTPVHSYGIGYAVLGVTAVLDAYSVMVGLRPLQEQAAERGLSSRLLATQHRPCRGDSGCGRWLRRGRGRRRHRRAGYQPAHG
jgi:hypothetical protein